MPAQVLFKGIAVVIDDELGVETSEIMAITREIEKDGGYVVGLKQLPLPSADLENFAGAAFFIMDWELHNAEVGNDATGDLVVMPAHLAKSQLDEKIAFLRNLSKCRHAPVFIFTNSSPLSVTEALADHSDLYEHDKPSHIFVMGKGDVQAAGVFNVLNDWAMKNPSALALKTWEHEYHRAKNALFVDFYNKSTYWPALLWQTFVEDGIDPSDELGRLISRILVSRMTPFHLDMSNFLPDVKKHQEDDLPGYQKALAAVLEGERFIRKPGLHPESITPGDVFHRRNRYWLNIRPDCDCVLRDGETDIELYLLKGDVAKEKDLAGINYERGLYPETDAQAAVFCMLDGKTVVFKFGKLYTEKWSEWKDSRCGRLLQPFVTRVQQRYAGYLQRPGLPRIPKSLMPQSVIEAGEEAAVVPTAGGP